MKKKKYKIAIEETIAAEFIIEAMDAVEAAELTMEKYRNGEFVIQPGEVHQKRMAITFPVEEATAWTEFCECCLPCPSGGGIALPTSPARLR